MIFVLKRQTGWGNKVLSCLSWTYQVLIGKGQMIFPSQHISQVIHTAFSTEEGKVRINFRKTTLEVFPNLRQGAISEFRILVWLPKRNELNRWKVIFSSFKVIFHDTIEFFTIGIVAILMKRIQDTLSKLIQVDPLVKNSKLEIGLVIQTVNQVRIGFHNGSLILQTNRLVIDIS